MKRISRLLKPQEHHKVIYIKHLGREPYNEVKFDCGKTLIVSYSLRYWHSVFQDFQRINKSVLINPSKIISQQGESEVELEDNSKFIFSRRKYKYKNLQYNS
ncbi:MAG: LytTR family transcriptional regulator DNA-binding domain-containing protein [Emticicia sp.]|uniref:LytTR family transcriptional regulator DNA-binding domain-containing protein n=1 Tax=Emticicia sp. TaxID=1930953 RepID=UPI003BA7282E